MCGCDAVFRSFVSVILRNLIANTYDVLTTPKVFAQRDAAQMALIGSTIAETSLSPGVMVPAMCDCHQFFFFLFAEWRGKSEMNSELC